LSTAIAAILEPADQSSLECTGRWLAYLVALDQGHIDQASEHLARMQALESLMPKTWSNIIAVESAYLAGWFRRSADEARLWLDRLPASLLIAPYDRLRADAALAVATGDRGKARDLLEEALNSAPANALWARDRLNEMLLDLDDERKTANQSRI